MHCRAMARLNIRHTLGPSRLAVRDAKADDPASEDVHHHHDPVALEQN